MLQRYMTPGAAQAHPQQQAYFMSHPNMQQQTLYPVQPAYHQPGPMKYQGQAQSHQGHQYSPTATYNPYVGPSYQMLGTPNLQQSSQMQGGAGVPVASHQMHSAGYGMQQLSQHDGHKTLYSTSRPVLGSVQSPPQSQTSIPMQAMHQNQWITSPHSSLITPSHPNPNPFHPSLTPGSTQSYSPASDSASCESSSVHSCKSNESLAPSSSSLASSSYQSRQISIDIKSAYLTVSDSGSATSSASSSPRKSSRDSLTRTLEYTKDKNNSRTSSPPIAPHPFATWKSNEEEPGDVGKLFQSRASSHGIRISSPGSEQPQSSAWSAPKEPAVKMQAGKSGYKEKVKADRFMEIALKRGITVSKGIPVVGKASSSDTSTSGDTSSIKSLAAEDEHLPSTESDIDNCESRSYFSDSCSQSDGESCISDFSNRFARSVIENACAELVQEARRLKTISDVCDCEPNTIQEASDQLSDCVGDAYSAHQLATSHSYPSSFYPTSSFEGAAREAATLPLCIEIKPQPVLNAQAKEFVSEWTSDDAKGLSLNPESPEFKPSYFRQKGGEVPSQEDPDPVIALYKKNCSSGVDVFISDPAETQEENEIAQKVAQEEVLKQVQKIDAAVNTRRIKHKDAEQQTPLAFKPRDVSVNIDEMCMTEGSEFYTPEILMRTRGTNTVPMETQCRAVQTKMNVKTKSCGVQVASDEFIPGTEKDPQILDLQMRVCHLSAQICISELERQKNELQRSKFQINSCFSAVGSEESSLGVMLDARISLLEEDISQLKLRLANCLKELKSGQPNKTLPTFGISIPTSAGNILYRPKELQVHEHDKSQGNLVPEVLGAKLHSKKEMVVPADVSPRSRKRIHQHDQLSAATSAPDEETSSLLDKISTHLGENSMAHPELHSKTLSAPGHSEQVVTSNSMSSDFRNRVSEDFPSLSDVTRLDTKSSSHGMSDTESLKTNPVSRVAEQVMRKDNSEEFEIASDKESSLSDHKKDDSFQERDTNKLASDMSSEENFMKMTSGQESSHVDDENINRVTDKSSSVVLNTDSLASTSKNSPLDTAINHTFRVSETLEPNRTLPFGSEPVPTAVETKPEMGNNVKVPKILEDKTVLDGSQEESSNMVPPGFKSIKSGSLEECDKSTNDLVLRAQSLLKNITNKKQTPPKPIKPLLPQSKHKTVTSPPAAEMKLEQTPVKIEPSTSCDDRNTGISQLICNAKKKLQESKDFGNELERSLSNLTLESNQLIGDRCRLETEAKDLGPAYPHIPQEMQEQKESLTPSQNLPESKEPVAGSASPLQQNIQVSNVHDQPTDGPSKEQTLPVIPIQQPCEQPLHPVVPSQQPGLPQPQSNAGQINPNLYQTVLAQVARAYPHLAANPMMLHSVCLQQTMVLQSYMVNAQSSGPSSATSASGSAPDVPPVSSPTTSSAAPTPSSAALTPANQEQVQRHHGAGDGKQLCTSALQAVRSATSHIDNQNQLPVSEQNGSSWNPSALVNMMHARKGTGDARQKDEPQAVAPSPPSTFMFQASATPKTEHTVSCKADATENTPASLKDSVLKNRNARAVGSSASGEVKTKGIPSKETNPFEATSPTSEFTDVQNRKKRPTTKGKACKTSQNQITQPDLFPQPKAIRIPTNEDWENQCERYPADFVCKQDVKAPVYFTPIEPEATGSDDFAVPKPPTQESEEEHKPRGRGRRRNDSSRSSTRSNTPTDKNSESRKNSYLGLDDFGSDAEAKPNKLDTNFLGRLLKNNVRSNNKKYREKEDRRVNQTSDLEKQVEVDEEDWQTVSMKKRKRDQSRAEQLPSMAVIPACPSKIQPKAPRNNFEKLVEHLEKTFPFLSRMDIKDLIQTIRYQRGGGLTGMKMNDIVDSAKLVVQQKLQSRMVEEGGKPLQITQQSTKNVYCTPEFQKHLEMTKTSLPSRPQVKSPGVTSNDEDFCPICFEDFSHGKKKRLDCGHEFHMACIKEWVCKHERTCPTCRRLTLFHEEFPRLK